MSIYNEECVHLSNRSCYILLCITPLQVSFMVKLIPSPDWFVGLASFDMCQRNRWKKYVEIDLYPLDAGTDNGLAFSSPNWPSKPAEPIYQLSPSEPNHAASSFYYPEMESLPPIAKVKLVKISGK